MNQIDNKFFEAYKHLDKLCGEILNCDNGVSEYISEMETTPQGQYKAASWSSDYKSLKHIRWVRNQIAHSTSDCVYSNYEDLEVTESFYDRIMNQEDPLAQLRKAEQKRQTNTLKRAAEMPVYDGLPYDSSDKTKTGCFVIGACVIVIAFIVMLLVAVGC